MLPNSLRAHCLLLILSFLLLTPSAGAAQTDREVQPGKATASVSPATAPQFAFRIEPNRGQAPQEFDYLARARAYTALISSQQLAFSVAAPQPLVSLEEQLAARWNPAAGDTLSTNPRPPADLVRMRLLRSNPRANAELEDQQESVGHYFKGTDQSKWIREVPHFSRLRYHDIYPQIDMLYHQVEGSLKFDLIVQPGGDPRDIQLEFSGMETLSVDPQGGLLIRTRERTVQMVIPEIFQLNGEERRAVEGRFVQNSPNQVALEIGDYEQDLPLYIDPLLLVFERTLVSEAGTRLEAVGIDIFGDTIVAGVVLDPITNDQDLRIARFSAQGNLLFDLQVGGSDLESASSVVVLDSFRILVAGTTDSNDLPVPFASTLQPYAGDGDGYILRLLGDLSGIDAGTFLGGAAAETIQGLTVNSADQITVAGRTDSSDFPLVNELSTFQGQADGFVTQLELQPLGSAIVFSTTLGGTNFDAVDALAIDQEDNLYLGGRTDSQAFPTAAFQANGFQTAFAGGTGVDGFVAKLSSDGSEIVYATYFGGTEGDLISDLAVDPGGRVLAVGSGGSSDLPLLPNTLQPSLPYDGPTGFFLRFSASGSVLEHSTPLGTWFSSPEALALGHGGHVYIVGTTEQPFPGEWPNQEVFGGGQGAYLAVLGDLGGTIDDLIYLTPASAVATGEDVAVEDTENSVYVVGTSAEVLSDEGDVLTTDVDSGFLHKYRLGFSFEYAAKVVCGIQPTPAARTGILARGQYGSSVNIHNPTAQTVRLRKTLAMSAPRIFTSLPEQPGPILPIATHDLRSNQAMRVDCEALNQEVGPNNGQNQWPPTGFMEGFVIIESDGPLNITAVYTSGPLPGQQQPTASVPGIDVEQINERSRQMDHDISVATEISCLPHPEATVFVGETKVTNNGSIAVENVLVEDFFDGTDLGDLPSDFFGILRESYTVSHGATWLLDSSEIDGERVRGTITIPVLPPGQSARITRNYLVFGGFVPFNPNIFRVVVTAKPKPEDPFKSNNSSVQPRLILDCSPSP